MTHVEWRAVTRDEIVDALRRWPDGPDCHQVARSLARLIAAAEARRRHAREDHDQGAAASTTTP
jgi:hypothetical protein